MPAGRPSKLNQELIDKAEEYLKSCNDRIETTDKGALSYVNVSLPSVVGLALYIGVNKDTIYTWCKGDSDIEKQFSDIVKRVNNEQENRLLNNGLGGLYAPKVVGMVLSKHGYSEKTETDITSKGEKLTIGDPQLAADFDEFRKQRLKGD